MGVRRELGDNFFNGGVNQLQFVSLATVASPPPLGRAWRGATASWRAWHWPSAAGGVAAIVEVSVAWRLTTRTRARHVKE